MRLVARGEVMTPLRDSRILVPAAVGAWLVLQAAVAATLVVQSATKTKLFHSKCNQIFSDDQISTSGYLRLQEKTRIASNVDTHAL